jgi:hypothetical protein
VIHRLFAEVPWDGLPVIDEELRSWHLPRWFEGTPGEIERMEKKNDADRLCVALLSCHPSGYSRWEALRSMAGDPVELVIPFVMMRLVDWVEPVRTLAEEELRRRLVAENAPVLAQCFGLLERLSGESRFREEYWEWIEGLLRTPECAAALIAGMKSESLALRRRCFRMAAGNPAIAGGEVLRLALGDPDVVVRKWAFTAGIGSADELMPVAAKDPYAPIRRMAFEYFQERAETSREELRPFLMDRSVGIRRACQAAWDRPVEVYREAIGAQSGKTAIAVLGLGETGDDSDAQTIAGMLGHRSARVRCAAVRALRMVSAAGHREELLHVVETDVPSVAREAAWSLMVGREVAADVMWEAAKKNSDAQVRLVVLSMMLAAGKWVRLRMYLEAAGSAEARVSERAVELLMAWAWRFNDSFAQPSREDVEVSRALMERSSDALPAGLARELGLILEAAGG